MEEPLRSVFGLMPNRSALKMDGAQRRARAPPLRYDKENANEPAILSIAGERVLDCSCDDKGLEPGCMVPRGIRWHSKHSKGHRRRLKRDFGL